MNFFKIGIITAVSGIILYQTPFACASDYDKKEDDLNNKFYFVKQVECSNFPEHWINCELKFSEPERSLNRINIANTLKFNLTQHYKIDTSGGIQIYDLREISKWKRINEPSLNYIYNLKNDLKPKKGTKNNIFGIFTQEDMEFGNYVMNVKFLDHDAVDFTFSILPKPEEKY